MTNRPLPVVTHLKPGLLPGSLLVLQVKTTAVLSFQLKSALGWLHKPPTHKDYGHIGLWSPGWQHPCATLCPAGGRKAFTEWRPSPTPPGPCPVSCVFFSEKLATNPRAIRQTRALSSSLSPTESQFSSFAQFCPTLCDPHQL